MTHHGRGLRRLLKDDLLADAIEQDWRSAPLSHKRKTMLSYVTKLTLTPAQMTQSDVQELRGAGFSDRDVLDIVEVTAYYAYANRVADGLGIPSESWIAD
ncbi:MAG: peroxidase-related enzyme [Actinomycetota bacterium]|nr:peroxidase-related enzyme [Actinomycetota bacterium]MEC9059619.1 peroxidase-related enzyme [Actinomycetota bacterium]MED5361403.1 peroxidase-related enzyme [Actinomycetota bacterium]